MISFLKRNSIKLREKFANTIFIHIGKCGGSTVAVELKKRGIPFYEKHICKVNYSSSKNYILVIRNPISRFISAFNWRYKLVCEIGKQSNRFEGEASFLQKYKSVNNLAENIYDVNGNLKIDFSQDDCYIHHIREDIDFYIGDFLKECERKNNITVLLTESLNEDLKGYYGINVTSHLKKNKHSEKVVELSNTACQNLKKYLRKDYECIDKLYEYGYISEKKYKILSK